MNEVAHATPPKGELAAPPATARALVVAGVGLLPAVALAGALYALGSAELLAFSPELVLIGAALVFPMAPRKLATNAPLAIGAAVAILIATALTADMLMADVFGYSFAAPLMGAPRLIIAGGTLSVDSFALTFNLIFLVIGLLVAVASVSKEVDQAPYQGIYFSLLLLTIVGTMVVAASMSLITVFLGLELAGISTYAMVAFVKSNKLSSEAAVKYYIIGSVSTALVLFGLSYLYGITGSLDIPTIARRLNGVSPSDSGVIMAVVFLAGGFGFKMAAVPFHMWAPDTYTGAPSPVSALLAAGTKKMGFAAAFKVVVVGMFAVRAEWSAVFGILAVLTMTVGNLAAARQTNMKRLLSYSSIAQAGYILAALAIAGTGSDPTSAASQTAVAAGIFHSATHMVMKGAAFILVGMLIVLQVGDDVDDLKGLNKRSPFTALVLALTMLSLVGMPGLVGFWSKAYIVVAGANAYNEGSTWALALTVAVVLNSAFSLYYYVRVIRVMYFSDAQEDLPPLKEPRHIKAVLAACLAFMLVGFVAVQPLFALSLEAARSLLSLL